MQIVPQTGGVRMLQQVVPRWTYLADYLGDKMGSEVPPDAAGALCRLLSLDGSSGVTRILRRALWRVFAGLLRWPRFSRPDAATGTHWRQAARERLGAKKTVHAMHDTKRASAQAVSSRYLAMADLTFSCWSAGTMNMNFSVVPTCGEL